MINNYLIYVQLNKKYKKGNEMRIGNNGYCKEDLELVTKYGYPFPEEYIHEAGLRAQDAGLDWYNNLKEDGTHPYFESYDECMGAYLDGYWTELKL